MKQNMKSSIKYLLFSAAMLGNFACTDLDVNINSQYTQYPDNEVAVGAKLNACYYYMRNEACLGRNYWEGVMLEGDELMGVSFNGSYYDNGRLVLPSVHNLNPDLSGVGQMGDLMSGCTYCSQVISEMGGAELNDPLVAPVRAARAFYLFMMMDLYGDVPIVNHALDDGEVFERSPRAEVAEYIESELLDIIPQLTETNDETTYGTPNKWMAEALLVKLYLNWGVYTNDITTVDNNTTNPKLNDCVEWCDALINSKVFEVGKGYRKKFFPDNGVQIKDFIYAMPFDPASLGFNYVGGHEFDRFCTFKKANNCDPGPWGYQPSKSVAGAYILTPECAARFTLKGDERNDIILEGPQYVTDAQYNFTSTPLEYKGEQVNYSREISFIEGGKSTLDVGDNMTGYQQGCHLAKYPAQAEVYSDWSRKMNNDIPIFRYADILLTKAECILRGATATLSQTPASLINEVRDCSGAENISGTVTLQDVLDERGRELIAEMWRRQDLIRFGQFENDWGFKNEVNPSAKTDKWRRLLPIPTGVMDTNTNWKQNTGY
jgi:hypothetical protein